MAGKCLWEHLAFQNLIPCRPWGEGAKITMWRKWKGSLPAW
jgi:hypothetical protein